jgi:hypothetical protein
MPPSTKKEKSGSIVTLPVNSKGRGSWKLRRSGQSPKNSDPRRVILFCLEEIFLPK